MDGHELTKGELSTFPRGPRGSGQNMFRMLLWAAFRNYYSRRRDALFPTQEAVFAKCIEWTREYHPMFAPETDT
jgi:hypothetical protein